jgi:hypothetical protein
MTTQEVQKALARKHAAVPPFRRVPCKQLPGMIAIPVEEKEETKNEIS